MTKDKAESASSGEPSSILLTKDDGLTKPPEPLEGEVVEDPEAEEAARRGYTIGTWQGLNNYVCNRCGAGFVQLRIIDEHVEKHVDLENKALLHADHQAANTAERLRQEEERERLARFGLVPGH